MRFGSLFAGIGGLDLGLERAGMECVWQVEIDDYCTRVLEKHWPDVRRYGDVKEVHGDVAHAALRDGRNFGSEEWRRQGLFGESDSEQNGTSCLSCLEPVDLIAGGFPCQPHSVAGKRRGAADDRNLWPEFIRIIRETRTRYVLAENVLGIITTYLDTVLSDLEGEGYTWTTLNLPACGFDAPHRRERIFIVAYANQQGPSPQRYAPTKRAREGRKTGSISASSNVPNPSGKRLEGSKEARSYGKDRKESSNELAWGCDRRGQTNWTVEPNVGRVAHGVPSRVDRLKGLGNAVVPAVAQYIGERILEHAKETWPK